MLQLGGPPVQTNLCNEAAAEVLPELGDGAKGPLVVHGVPENSPGRAAGLGLVPGDGGVPIGEALRVHVVVDQRTVGAGSAPIAAGVVGHRGEGHPVPEEGVPVQVDLRLMEVVLDLVEIVGVVSVEGSGPRPGRGVLFALVGAAHSVDVGAPAPVSLGVLVQGRWKVTVQIPGEIVAESRGVEHVAVLAMALRGAHGVKLQAILGIDLVGRGKVVGPGVGPGGVSTQTTVVHPVSGLPNDRACQGKLVRQLPSREHKRLFEKVPDRLPIRVEHVPIPGVVHLSEAKLLLVAESRRGPRGIGDDVHGPTDGGGRQVHGAQAPLKLNAGGGVAEAVPVRPVHPTVFHVVDGHAVDHDGHVSLAEATDVDPGVTGTTTALGGVNAGGDVQDHRKIPRAQLVLDLDLGDVRVSHGGLTLDGPGGENLQGVQGDSLGAEGEVRLEGYTSLQDHIVNGFQPVPDHPGFDAIGAAGA